MILPSLTALVCAASLLAGPKEVADGPIVDIVIGVQADRLEKFAAEELAAQLFKLYRANVTIRSEIPAQAEHVILVGTRDSHAALRRLTPKDWPKLSDQGQVLKSIETPNNKARRTLVVGGGSPVATLWAVYELGHRLGIRYLLSGDVYPAEPRPFGLGAFDLVLEPKLRLRTWRTINDFAIGPESWGLEEQQRVLKQLAKLKFNRVMLSVYAWQPFVDFEFQGVKKSTAMLWYGYRYRVDGDTPGRTVFQGAREFQNPDLANLESYEDLTAAGVKLASGILDTAHDLGMSCALAYSPLEFTREFASVLSEAKTLHSLESLVIGPGPRQLPDDPLFQELVQAQLHAYLKTYPQLDAVYFSMPEFPDWVEHYADAWRRLDERTGVGRVTNLDDLTAAARDRKLLASGDRGVQSLHGNIAALDFFSRLLEARKDWQPDRERSLETNLIQVDPALYGVLDKVVPRDTGVLHLVDYTARRVCENLPLLAQVPADKVRSSLILTLADDNVGVLPQMATARLHTLMGQLREHGWEGFSTRYWIPGDQDLAVQYLSRASFDAQATVGSVLAEMVAPMCGEGVAERLEIGFEKLQQATELIDQHDIGFTFPVPGVVMKQYASTEPVPRWWKEASDLYAGAMNEIYRANDRSLLPGRPYLRYLAKRCEFALEYLASIEALRKAALARQAHNSAEQVAQLEASVESMFNALNALGEVARDNSDRGVIAVLNEYGYRELVKEWEKAQDASSN